MIKTFFILRLMALVAFAAITSPNAFAQGGTPKFDESRFVPEERPAPLRLEAPEKPIPRKWLLAGLGVALLATSAVLYIAVKAWRSSNVFERKYHFPPAGQAALRLGGKRSGGFMVAIEAAQRRKGKT